ncbi:MAG: UvrD-helicase domain-containing protein [Candidatus Hydrogenedentes bacterium]|nr:UvrD-helicase domain-containing protein [Candidatus Hydrogenedentota bacterium]
MSDLNEVQRRAITDGDGHTLVLAGAGSGKTRVIVERLAWLAGERGVDPRNILAMTFTNRAAEEMRERVLARLGVDRLGAWLGTFHSFGLYVLRRDIDRLGRKKSFTVFDDTDQLSAMKRLVQDLPQTFARVSPREALQWVSRLKQDVASPDKTTAPASPEEESYRALWDRYHDALARASAVDFDDLLVLTSRLLEEHPEVREKYQRRYRYVHIDEYQDTNRAQYLIAKRLSEGAGNLFVVGDEDQSIYSWRGANIRNILDFERDFADAKVFRLEQNYRSTQAILAAANAVVANNEQRLGKTLWTAAQGGDRVRLYMAKDDEDEARFVIDEIASGGTALNETAVLYRTNGQARPIEEALRRKGLAYRVIGGVKFYARKEIKDILAYLRLLVNPEDDVSVRRVLNVPPRGIGGVSLERIEAYATERKLPLMQVLREIEIDQSLGPRPRDAAAEFVRLIDDLTLLAQTSKTATLVKTLLEKTKYRDYVQSSDERDFRARLEVVDEFVTACAQYDEKKSGDLLSFLQDLALVSDTDEYQAGQPMVTLMTCHSAKGLEFDSVFLVGLEEGLLPHANAEDSEMDVEEERRLCYVAMTRARKRLTLTAAESRMVYGQKRPCKASRFLDEIPSGQIEVLGEEEDETDYRRAGAPGGKARRVPAEAPKADAGRLKMGTRVRHARFGVGTVMYTSGVGTKLKARIRFATGPTREFMVSATPLEILEGSR